MAIGISAADGRGSLSDQNQLKRRKSLELPMLWLSPVRVLPMMALSIFVAEVGVMLLLYQLPAVPKSLEPLLDASLLLVLLSPTFYLFHYRPLRHHYEARKEIIDQLLRSEERLQLALNAVNDGLWDWNLETKELYLSPRGREILGYPQEEHRTQVETLLELVHPDDREEVLLALRQHLSGTTPSWRSEHRLRTRTGEWIWVLARGRVVEQNDAGNPIRAIGTFTDITQRKQAEQRLADSKEDILRLSRQLMTSSEEERKQVARDLHDEFGQVLTAFQMGVEMLQCHSFTNEEQYQAQCTRLLTLAERLQQNLRHISDRLRPVILDDLGLVVALNWLINEYTQQAQKIDFRFRCQGMEERLSSNHELILYRICQEALNNCIKHSGASRVDVDLTLQPDKVSLRVEDNGKGFMERRRVPRPSEHWGFGLLGIHERAATVNGKVKVRTAPGAGTAIEVCLPLTMGEGDA